MTGRHKEIEIYYKSEYSHVVSAVLYLFKNDTLIQFFLKKPEDDLDERVIHMPTLHIIIIVYYIIQYLDGKHRKLQTGSLAFLFVLYILLKFVLLK